MATKFKQVKFTWSPKRWAPSSLPSRHENCDGDRVRPRTQGGVTLPWGKTGLVSKLSFQHHMRCYSVPCQIWKRWGGICLDPILVSFVVALFPGKLVTQEECECRTYYSTLKGAVDLIGRLFSRRKFFFTECIIYMELLRQWWWPAALVQTAVRTD